MTDATARQKRASLVAAAIIVLAIALAFANGFVGPFVFDDKPSIPENPTIRHLADIAQVFSPPPTGGITVEGRPLLNASFAVSYALSGTNPWAYHLLNVLIHAGAALLLWGIIRRTLLLPIFGERFKESAAAVAFFTALLWAVHPLQTESVTYIVQRAESQASLLYLFTLYGFIRGTEEPGSRWLGLSVLSCLLGMASKELVVTAPFVVLLFDRTLVSGTFSAALKRRAGYYAGLFATLGLLLVLVAGTGWNRSGTIGVDVGVTPLRYALSQFRAIATYLKLAFWPNPLVFDYGVVWAHGAGDVLPYLVLVGSLGILTVIGLVRREAWGLAGLVFFAVLAPSSSLIPGNRQSIAEHRMYLPLAAVLVVFVSGVIRLLGRRAGLVLSLIALLLAVLTVRRNVDYRSIDALYKDTVEKAPLNQWAWNNYGDVLFKEGRTDEAVTYFQHSLALDKNFPDALYNLGSAELSRGHTQEAIRLLKGATGKSRLEATVENNLGNAYMKEGRMFEAVTEFEKAIHAKPDLAEAHYNLANALYAQGLVRSALDHYALAAKIAPAVAEIHNNYAIALVKSGDLRGAIPELERAIALKPGDPMAEVNLGSIYANLGQMDEAIRCYRAALAISPDFAPAQQYLARVQGASKTPATK